MQKKFITWPDGNKIGRLTEKEVEIFQDNGQITAVAQRIPFFHKKKFVVGCFGKRTTGFTVINL